MEDLTLNGGEHYIIVRGTNENNESVLFSICASSISMVVVSSIPEDTALENLLDMTHELTLKVGVTIYSSWDNVTVLETCLAQDQLRHFEEQIQDYKQNTFTLHVQNWHVGKVCVISKCLN